MAFGIWMFTEIVLTCDSRVRFLDCSLVHTAPHGRTPSRSLQNSEEHPVGKSARPSLSSGQRRSENSFRWTINLLRFFSSKVIISNVVCLHRRRGVHFGIRTIQSREARDYCNLWSRVVQIHESNVRPSHRLPFPAPKEFTTPSISRTAPHECIKDQVYAQFPIH